MSISEALVKLADNEAEISAAEKEVEAFRIRKTQGIYDKRRAITSDIPQFWYIVLAQNDDFGEYIRPEDLKYLEYIADIHVSYDIATASESTGVPENYRDFSITITFSDQASMAGESGLVNKQTVTKKFHVVTENGEERIYGEKAPVQWPAELESIVPQNVKDNKAGDELSTEEKRRYRKGMKSFFAWFDWTGRKPGKEFRNGEDLTRLIIDDLFPQAVKYYALALENGGDSENDSSEGEELDLLDDDHVDKKRKN